MTSKYPEDIKREMGKRLNLLYQETGMDAAELARAIGRTEAYLSQVKRGKTHLSPTTAEAIHALFPGYSVDYLMARSPYRNEQERRVEELKQAKHEDDMRALGFGAFSDALGYSLTATFWGVERVSVQGVESDEGTTTAPLEEEADADAIVEHTLNRLSDVKAWDRYVPAPGMLVARDGVGVIVPRKELDAVVDEVSEFVDFKLWKLLKKYENQGR